MTTIIVSMPSLGDGVTEATISSWLVGPDDTVEVGTPLLEVATDKVDTEIPSPAAGTIGELMVDESDVVDVGAALATIIDVEPIASSPEPAPSAAPPLSSPPAPAPALASASLPAVKLGPAAAPPVPSGVQRRSDTTSTGDAVADAAGRTTTERLSRIRQTIAKRMLHSLEATAQLTTVVEVDITAIDELRRSCKEQFLEATGTKLSFLPFFAQAAAEALLVHPVVGAVTNTDCTEVTYHHYVNLGIAVDGPKGLMVPVIRDADTLGISGLAVAIAETAAQVRQGAISPDALQGGTFTITNTGSRGALFDTPILNHPQSGILGTGAVVERVVPLRDRHRLFGFGVRSMVYLSITYDHRIVDGADAARFLGAVKTRLESGFTRDEVLTKAPAHQGTSPSVG